MFRRFRVRKTYVLGGVVVWCGHVFGFFRGKTKPPASMDGASSGRRMKSSVDNDRFVWRYERTAWRNFEAMSPSSTLGGDWITLGGSVMRRSNDLAVLIERWFTDRLMKHLGLSSNTIASYRCTFRLLFAFAQAPWEIPIGVGAAGFGRSLHRRFLEDLETKRAASVRTGISASQPSDPSSGMQRSRSRHVAPILSVCSRSPASDVTGGSFSF